jgi:phenylpropionate dioxygenase-like ring-hydroxylating dioxygenase large terminal subunit
VCRHRAHHPLEDDGSVRQITCPYHTWTYHLDGRLKQAPHTDYLVDFDPSTICLDALAVEEFGSFVCVNLDPTATPIARLAGDLATEIAHWTPDVERLTFAHRLTYEISSNWKNVIDNFLECYHCPVAHRDFCTLVDMDTYEFTTHGIWSSHMAEAGKTANNAYPVDGATVTDHAVWWLWLNTFLMRYPGRGNFIVMQVIPAGPDRTLETYDFFFEAAQPTAAQLEAIRYIDKVLQAEDIALVESVQRGMATPGFTQGQIVYDGEAQAAPNTPSTTSTASSWTPTRAPNGDHPSNLTSGVRPPGRIHRERRSGQLASHFWRMASKTTSPPLSRSAYSPNCVLPYP